MSEIIKEIEETFGEMTVKRGKEHVFVGMNVRFNEDGSINISMKEYLTECIKTF